MRRNFCILLLISVLYTSAYDKRSKVIVWYEGETYYKVLDSKETATLYFSEWNEAIQDFLKDEHYHVALKLDHRLDPIPSDDAKLPSLAMIAAINNKELIVKYLDFLENHSRTLGFNYLILPDADNLSHYEKEIVKTANEKSPYFFVDPVHLHKSIPDSKKEVDDEEFPIWVAKQTDDIKKLVKWNKKMSFEDGQNFYKGIVKSESNSFKESTYLPNHFLVDFFTQGSVAIDPDAILPIKSEAIVFIGEDEKLKRRLSQYVQVFDERQEKVFPVILDKRDNPNQEILGDEIILNFLGKETDSSKATILMPWRVENEDIILSKMLFGAQSIKGRYEAVGNRKIDEQGLIAYSDPSYEGMSEKKLLVTDSIVEAAISAFAIPGCQVLAMKNGSVVFEKAYGHFAYDSLKSLSKYTFFDIASITKVAATLPAIALLVDQGKLNLDDSISLHLSSFAGSNKSHITIKQLLAHNGGLYSYIPFWRRALDGDRLETFYYKTEEDERLDLRSYGMEPHPALKDSLKSWIIGSSLIKEPDQYNYSDIGFMILHLLVEEVSGQSFDEFLQENFYGPMGLHITFNPFQKEMTYQDIAPTEYDDRYRNGQIWGEVHDRNAHVFGGVAGHAGLFSNARDLAKMMLMFINDGYYGGHQYLSKRTLDSFNHQYFENNRRGLGWDKKNGDIGAASTLASDISFGHTGFTGTMVWTDPENDLIYVFLSNRIYPDANNTKLMQMNTRTSIHDVLYESFLND